MGCDIHMHVEFKVDGRWRTGDYFMPTPTFNPLYPDDSMFIFIPVYDDRNYDLFAILADVRNYGGNDYISEPRGLPDDVTTYVKLKHEEWGYDAHSASYVTLKELIDFQSENHPLKHKGMISPDAIKALDNDGILPTTWCQATNSTGWAWRTWEEENNVLTPIIKKLKERADDIGLIYSFYWTSSNESHRKEAYEKASDIRIVFWFDN